MWGEFGEFRTLTLRTKIPFSYRTPQYSPPKSNVPLEVLKVASSSGGEMNRKFFDLNCAFGRFEIRTITSSAREPVADVTSANRFFFADCPLNFGSTAKPNFQSSIFVAMVTLQLPRVSATMPVFIPSPCLPICRTSPLPILDELPIWRMFTLVSVPPQFLSVRFFEASSYSSSATVVPACRFRVMVVRPPWRVLVGVGSSGAHFIIAASYQFCTNSRTPSLLSQLFA